MTIAFDVMLELSRRLGETYEGDLYKATSAGTTSTVVSTHLTQADDYWNGGTIFITYDAGGLGAAPENESREITDFTATTDTVTVTTAFSAATASGDKFAITKKTFPRTLLMRAINSALRWFGDVPTFDDTSLDTAADTLEYSLPAAAVRSLRQVRIATSTSSPYGFVPFPYWEVNNGKLVFRVQPSSGYDIRLAYMAPHSSVSADSDVINPHVHMESLYWFALAECYFAKLQSTDYDERKWKDLYNQSLQLAEKYKKENPPPKMNRDPSYAFEAGGRTSIFDRIADPS